MTIIYDLFYFNMVPCVRPLRPSAAGGRTASLSALAMLILSLVCLFPTAARADCTNPAGVAGEQVYNTTHATMQFCDGTNWYSMKGGAVAEDTLADLSCSNNQIPKWNGTVWACAADAGIIAETDPQVAVVTSGKWCIGNGSAVTCNQNAPS